MKIFLGALVAVGMLVGLGACSNLPAGEPADETPIYGSSTPR